jgi:hypothetical protein
MANPAPTAITINAFDVNVGTVIDFNIIGGTNIVRSNKLYVYDLNNELIFTHVYVSTESIHELPTKTDSSIVYASGKTSNDFVNQQQYYARIQTFTNTEATEGSSGYSISKLFWALPTPTLNIDTIPASIEITSYNCRAVFNTNINLIGITPNTIQQYQFDLYKSVGVLAQSSGVLVGSGTPVSGTTNQYEISYNFNGLEDLTSYYIVVTVVTIDGMTLTQTSSTFLVNVNAPTLGEATVVNNACDGYISITSNLSASYSSEITKILVKRLDKSNVSNSWLTLFSIDVNEASDMDFTVIDFFNRYGREYQYALVPVMVQNQGTTSDPIYVEVEGGYTTSGVVKSVFDGVFIADNTAIQKLQAGVGYNGVSLVQDVGTIETIGNKYPIIVSNNNLKYHIGTIYAYTFHDGLYSMNNYTVLEELIDSAGISFVTSQGDVLIAVSAISAKDYAWSRTAIAAAREAIEQFLVNKSPKIIKDWNGNMWLVMFTSDVELSFVNDWGMGISSFSANWTEIGDPEDQYDLQNSGLINIGGV